MVAYSFKKQFADRIEAGTKRQTIRADRKRHARAGEQLQLYTGMRTQHCRLIGRAVCKAVTPIRLDFRTARISIGGMLQISKLPQLEEFAIADGFDSFLDMRQFWIQTHDAIEAWDGILIEWRDFQLP